MENRRQRARRYSFVASIELVDVKSATQTKGQTEDLSLFGCRVGTPSPLPTETRVRIKIVLGDAHFAAIGRVAYIDSERAMGVVFTMIERNDQSILERWIQERRDGQEPHADEIGREIVA